MEGLTMIFTGLGFWFLLSLAFGAGWVIRGLLSVGDVDELLRLEGRVAELEAARWAKQQGLVR
jgi:hypothetical protein